MTYKSHPIQKSLLDGFYIQMYRKKKVQEENVRDNLYNLLAAKDFLNKTQNILAIKKVLKHFITLKFYSLQNKLRT